MAVISQLAVVTLSNLRSLPQRLGPSLVIVLGIAGVVGVLVSILAIATGFNSVMTGTARADRVMVLDANGFGNTEAYSYLSREAVQTILAAPGVARDSTGKPVISAESFRSVRVDAPNGKRISVVLRGVGPANAQLRPELRIIEGRAFEPGRHELIVGARLGQRSGLTVGSDVHLREGDWIVVGVFESGDAHESELIGDADTTLSMLRADTFQSVTARVSSPQDVDTFKAALAANPSLKVKVLSEIDYYRDRTSGFGALLYAVGWVIGGIMALGALFGALNSMYTAVASRVREIATLRAIGFGAGSVVGSLFIEALLLALAGGALGATVAGLAFNGWVISTPATGDSGADGLLTFAITVTPGLLVAAILLAAGIGLLGALFPAIRAAHAPVATALQVR